MNSDFPSYAKVNLHLQVVGRRPDSYHELRTLFQTIDLHDRMSVEIGGRSVGLDVCEGDAPAGASNLAYRAAERYLEEWGGAAGVQLGLWKRLPVGGGLGAGSSNAATVLLALRRLLGAPENVSDLWPVARALGADVPFFLFGGTALGFGRGDELVALDDLVPAELCIVVPPVHVSTAEVFGAIERLTESPLSPSIMALLERRRPIRLEEVTGRNDLAEIVYSRFPVVREVQSSLIDAGAGPVNLSGSGSTLFMVGSSTSGAGELGERLPRGTEVLRARTLRRVEYCRSFDNRESSE